MEEAVYPLAKQGIFHTIQGEGSLMGMPSVFVRLAGCPVSCPECDTDYAADSMATAQEIAKRAAELATVNTRWAWITNVGMIRDSSIERSTITHGYGG